jgi:hypothetical protein
MPLLTDALRGIAGAVKSDALKEAERLLAPKSGFFSKLEDVAGGLNFTKMPSTQLKSAVEGRGVSPTEYQNVLGSVEGTVNKEEVMGMIGKNKTELKDVVLGDKVDKLSVDELNDFHRLNTLQREFTPDEMAKYDFYESELKRADNLKPHYEQYSEPGYIPGSYRERFITAPEAGKLDSSVNDANRRNGWDIKVPFEESKVKWQDGHSAYSNIQNPVVRLRTNDREVGGKKILFVEEMQEPLKSTGDLQKMPKYLQERTYDLGVKKALMLAKEGNYDGIAWTTGEMQVARYPQIREFVDNISWTKTGEAKVINIKLKSGHNDYETAVINKDGIVEEGRKEWMNKHIAQILPKKTSEEILTASGGHIKGEDITIGDKGLKDIYDRKLPSLFKKYGKEEVKEIPLVEEKVSKFNNYAISRNSQGRYLVYNPEDPMTEVTSLGTKEEAERFLSGLKKMDTKKGVKVPYIPITQKTPSRHPVYSFIPPTLAGIVSMYDKEQRQ